MLKKALEEFESCSNVGNKHAKGNKKETKRKQK